MSEVSFDGINRLIIAGTGTTALDVASMYSRWKEWVATSDNSKFLPAFSVVGGDPTIEGQYMTSYFFLENGWKIRPYEGNHVLNVSGIVLSRDGQSPFVTTLGNYNVSIRSIVPVRTETVIMGGSMISPEDLLDFDDGIEPSMTMRQALQIMLAVLAGKTSITGQHPTIMKFRDTTDTKDRATFEVEGSDRVNAEFNKD